MRIVYCHFLASCISRLVFRLGKKSNIAQKERCVGELFGSAFVQTVYIFLPFPVLFCLFYILFHLFNSSLPFVILLYPFPPSFTLSYSASYILPYFVFTISFFYSFLFLRPFYNLFYLFIFPFVLSLFFALIPFILALFFYNVLSAFV